MRNLYISIIVGGLLLTLGCQAGAKTRLPKHSSSSTAAETTVFSSPDAQPDVVPGFVGKGGKAVHVEMEDRLPEFAHARLLENLTSQQTKAIDKLQRDTNTRVQAIQEYIDSLKQKLDVAKAHPNLVIYVQNEPLPRPTDIRAEIEDARKRIERKRQDALHQLSTILTEEQMAHIKRIRQGELLQPLPAAVTDEQAKPTINKKRRTIFGAFWRKS